VTVGQIIEETPGMSSWSQNDNSLRVLELNTAQNGTEFKEKTLSDQEKSIIVTEILSALDGSKQKVKGLHKTNLSLYKCHFLIINLYLSL